MNDTQLNAVLSRLDSLQQQVGSLVEHQQKQQELLDELVLPIAREFMQTATGRLSELEKEGYFAFGRELMKVGQRIVTSYSTEDVRQLGDAVTSILDAVRSMTQPEVLQIAGEASDVLTHADVTEPIGLMGMVRATRDQDVGRGMAMMFEVLRRVGHGAQVVADKQSKNRSRRDKVNALLAPRRGTQRLLGTEHPTPRRAAQAAAVKAAPPPAGAVVIDGVKFNPDGHLVDPQAWSKDLAKTLAEAQGLAMSDAHWKVVEFARKDFTETKASPNIRRITLQTGMATKDLYGLFPKAPARTVAKIAGIPKPTGCL